MLTRLDELLANGSPSFPDDVGLSRFLLFTIAIKSSWTALHLFVPHRIEIPFPIYLEREGGPFG